MQMSYDVDDDVIDEDDDNYDINICDEDHDNNYKK